LYRKALKARLRNFVLKRLHIARAGHSTSLFIWLIKGYNRFRPSAQSVSVQVHLLYMANRLPAALSLSKAGLLKYSNSQAFLLNALKVAWLARDMDLVRTLARMISTHPRVRHDCAHYLFLRKGADPVLADAVDRICFRVRARLDVMQLYEEQHPEAEDDIRILDTLDEGQLDEATLVRLSEAFPGNSSLVRMRALGKARAGDWFGAYGILAAALEAAPGQDAKFFDMIVEAALYFDDAPEKVKHILEVRAKHGARQAGFDKSAALARMLDGDLVDYIRLRGAQPSNLVARRIYGKRASVSMGLDATPFSGQCESLFVIGRDGVGDEVRWAQYYSGLTQHYKNVSISCDPRLTGLFERSFPSMNFYPVSRNWGRNLGPEGRAKRDRVPAMDLATRLDNPSFDKSLSCEEVSFIEDIGVRTWLTQGGARPQMPENGNAGYLQPNPDRSVYWAERLSRLVPNRPRIGIIWRSGLQDVERNQHYLSIEDFKPLTALPVSLISIQHNVEPAERLAGEAINVRFFDGEVDFYNDFDEIAAFTGALDLVVGISTLPYELAAAVGTPAWLCAVSPLGKWWCLEDPRRSGPDRRTPNGKVYIPAMDNGYLAEKHVRAGNIMAQIVSDIEQNYGLRSVT